MAQGVFGQRQEGERKGKRHPIMPHIRQDIRRFERGEKKSAGNKDLRKNYTIVAYSGVKWGGYSWNRQYGRRDANLQKRFRIMPSKRCRQNKVKFPKRGVGGKANRLGKHFWGEGRKTNRRGGGKDYEFPNRRSRGGVDEKQMA